MKQCMLSKILQLLLFLFLGTLAISIEAQAYVSDMDSYNKSHSQNFNNQPLGGTYQHHYYGGGGYTRPNWGGPYRPNYNPYYDPNFRPIK